MKRPNETRPTPGPWKVKTGTYFRNHDEGNMDLVEYKWVGYGPVGDETPVLARHIPENEANAALIAAAPEMLDRLYKLGDAITDMFEQMEKGNWVDELGHSVHQNEKMLALLEAMKPTSSLIAKARGGES